LIFSFPGIIDALSPADPAVLTIFLRTKLADGTAILFAGGQAVDPLLSPAGLAAGHRLGAVHASGATVLHLPAGVKAEIVAYRRQVEVFGHKLLNEAQPFEVVLGIKAAAASPLRLDYPLPLPDTDGLGVDIE
jgi:hypothetical protein